MFTSFINQFVREEDGQDMVEYSLLIAFIALAAMGVLGTIQTNLTTIWGHVSTKVNDAATASAK